MIAAALLTALACQEVNQPPRFLMVSGREVLYQLGEPVLDGRLNVLPGETLEIRLTVEEPEGQAISIWWPAAPMGFRWSSESLSAAWDVPADWWAEENTLGVIALDDAEPPAGAALSIPVNVAIEEEGAGDTGDTGG